jgi:RTA1 like protein
MSVAPPGVNSTLWNEPWLCTYATCPVSEFGQLQYIPSLAGNAFYLAIFALGLLIQIGLGIRYRTWGYLVAMIGGTGLEIVGYTARIELHIDDFNNNYFIIYLVGLTIGPAFFSAAIYLCLARIIAVYGNNLSWLTPKLITCFFIACDFVSLLLQAAGGALASLANTKSQERTGVNIMIAGLSTQVVSTFAFICICCQLAWSVRRNSLKVNPNSLSLRRSTKFRYFLAGESIPSTRPTLSRSTVANGMAQ